MHGINKNLIMLNLVNRLIDQNNYVVNLLF